MSLSVYNRKDDIPENVQYVDNNNLFFNVHTDIPDSELSREILKDIEMAEYAGPKKFKGRTKEFGEIYKEYLSTELGYGPSSINQRLAAIKAYPDKCFDLVECGANALDFVAKIHDGHVFWKNIIAFPEGDESCDIDFKGKHYENIIDFLNSARYDDGRHDYD